VTAEFCPLADIVAAQDGWPSDVEMFGSAEFRSSLCLIWSNYLQGVCSEQHLRWWLYGMQEGVKCLDKLSFYEDMQIGFIEGELSYLIYLLEGFRDTPYNTRRRAR